MSKARVLLVDDEEQILRSLKGGLEDEGYEVLTARDGHGAMELVRTRHPHVIFLDIWLPGMDGFETLRAVKSFDADLEVVIMTGHGTVSTAVQAMKEGAADFLEKPLSLDGVLEVLRRILEQTSTQKDMPEIRPHHPRKDELIGTSDVVARLKREIQRLAQDDHPILLLGEAGTGKELVARIIHSHQSRLRRRSMIKFSCSIWPEEELEAALFGTGEAGAVGGLKKREGKRGIIDQAAGRTLYIEGIEFLTSPLQRRLLGYLEGRTSPAAIFVSLPRGPSQIILSSTQNLRDLAAAGSFDRALIEFFRDHTIEIEPLRRRKADIPELARFFLQQFCVEYGRKPKDIDDDALEALAHLEWPGNIKELKNIIERLVISVPSTRITLKDIPPSLRGQEGLQIDRPRLQVYEVWDSYQKASESWEREYLLYHLRKHRWDLPSAAQALKMDPERLAARVEQLGLWKEEGIPSPFVRQRTLRRSMVLAGQGLHSGVKTGLILTPLPPHQGILFGNISTGESLPAHLDYVESTEYATSLKKGTTYARTAEHFLAVLHCYRITNLLVKINDEFPIMDGSALDFCRMVEDAGIEEQEAPCREIVIDRTLVVGEESPQTKFIRIEPSETLQVHYILQYPPPIGRQEYIFTLKDETSFREEIAPARTFGFVKDIEQLERMGLASGGRLNNVILVDQEKVVNTTLRFPDEFARHKILDILGDFYLLGRPIRGKITANMTGHSENYALMKLIKEEMNIT